MKWLLYRFGKIVRIRICKTWLWSIIKVAQNLYSSYLLKQVFQTMSPRFPTKTMKPRIPSKKMMIQTAGIQKMKVYIISRKQRFWSNPTYLSSHSRYGTVVTLNKWTLSLKTLLICLLGPIRPLREHPIRDVTLSSVLDPSALSSGRVVHLGRVLYIALKLSLFSTLFTSALPVSGSSLLSNVWWRNFSSDPACHVSLSSCMDLPCSLSL